MRRRVALRVHDRGRAVRAREHDAQNRSARRTVHLKPRPRLDTAPCASVARTSYIYVQIYVSPPRLRPSDVLARPSRPTCSSMSGVRRRSCRTHPTADMPSAAPATPFRVWFVLHTMREVSKLYFAQTVVRRTHLASPGIAASTQSPSVPSAAYLTPPADLHAQRGILHRCEGYILLF